MATDKSATANPSPSAPPPQEIDENPKAGPGQVVVTSPTGAKSVVDEDAAASLKPQGYKIGS